MVSTLAAILNMLVDKFNKFIIQSTKLQKWFSKWSAPPRGDTNWLQRRLHNAVKMLLNCFLIRCHQVTCFPPSGSIMLFIMVQQKLEVLVQCFRQVKIVLVFTIILFIFMFIFFWWFTFFICRLFTVHSAHTFTIAHIHFWLAHSLSYFICCLHKEQVISRTANIKQILLRICNFFLKCKK